jgi:hypothetical protein
MTVVGRNGESASHGHEELMTGLVRVPPAGDSCPKVK